MREQGNEAEKKKEYIHSALVSIPLLGIQHASLLRLVSSKGLNE